MTLVEHLFLHVSTEGYTSNKTGKKEDTKKVVSHKNWRNQSLQEKEEKVLGKMGLSW